MSKPTNEPGPFGSLNCPDQLQAHVVSPGPKARIHGYAVEDDLAGHYSLVDALALTLCGELPDSDARACLEQGLWLSVPIHVGQAPAHTALLARICGATEASIVSVGALALAQHAADLVHRHLPWLEWLATDQLSAPPVEFQSAEAANQRSVQIVTTRLQERGLTCRALSVRPTVDAARLALLFEGGLRSSAQLTTAIVWAGLPAVAAEGFAVGPVAFKDYPMKTPGFVYKPPQTE